MGGKNSKRQRKRDGNKEIRKGEKIRRKLKKKEMKIKQKKRGVGGNKIEKDNESLSLMCDLWKNLYLSLTLYRFSAWL